VRGLERLFEIGVLGLDIGADVGGKRLGLLHHLLPVVGAQPVIGILPGDAVMGGGMLAAFGDGGSGHRLFSVALPRGTRGDVCV